ncbi:MAG: 5-oxoprolinase subunit PxpA [Cyclobacteriaceae bacterium]
MTQIGLNCDVGEGIGNDAAIMPFIHSCNIACGGHAGNEQIMEDTIKLGIDNQVKIGAHPSYPDKENFGRQVMDLPREELIQSIKAQIEKLNSLAIKLGARLSHVKPHGTLYNQATKEENEAHCIIEAMSNFEKLSLYAPYKSVIAELAEQAGIHVMYEAFADRQYNDDLTLVSRTIDGSVLHDENSVIEHVQRVISDNKIITRSGKTVDIKVDTICVHGDNPKALEIVKSIYREFFQES